MDKTFVISDVHGCLQTLKRLIFQLQPSRDDLLIFLGDYVSKGPSPLETIEYLIELQSRLKVSLLMGNHDMKLLCYLENPLDQGLETEQIQLGNQDLFYLSDDAIEKVKRFLYGLKYYHESEKFLFVHAGFDFDHPDPFHDHKAMLEIRGMKYHEEKANGRRIVHGHDPVDVNHTRHAIANNAVIIPLDNGCVYNKLPGKGVLTCLELPEGRLHHQPNCE